MHEPADPAPPRGPFALGREHWLMAGLGGLIGTVLSLGVVFGAGALGFLPGTGDARIHAYLLSHPAVLYEMANAAQNEDADQAQQRLQAAVDKIGLAKFFDPSIAYVTGPAGAKNSFVEFFDYNCAHCRNTFAAVKKFYAAHKTDTRFAFVEFPIFGDASSEAARVAIAARNQGDAYLALHFLLMSEKAPIDTNLLFADAQKAGLNMTKLDADVLNPNVGRTILDAHNLAQDVTVGGTPFFIINGTPHEGEITDAELKRLAKS